MFPGKNIDGILQAFIEVLVEDSVCFMIKNIIIAKTLSCCKLIKKFAQIFKRTDINNSKLLYGLKEGLESSVKFRTEIPQNCKSIPSFFCQFPGGINHSHPIA